MKRDTNITFNSQIEIGDTSNGYVYGDLLDANATAALIDQKLNSTATQEWVNNKLNDILGADYSQIQHLISVLSDDDTTTGIMKLLAQKADNDNLASVAFNGNYNSLINKPLLFSGSYTDLTDKPSLFSGSYTDLTDKPTLFSGSYNDLTNKPVAQKYYNFTSYDTTGETQYATGIAKLTGGVVNSKYEIEVLYQDGFTEWIGKKFYVSNEAEVGDTLYPLYDIQNNAVGVSVKITSELS